jgi:hypothetical protein
VIETDAKTEAATLAALVGRLKASLTDGDVEEARAPAREMVSRWPEEDRARYWARVLAPPKVTVVPGEPRRILDRERAWLRKHAGEYPGCWLAVNGDALVTADRDLSAVLKTVRETPGGEKSLIHYDPT